MEIPGTPTDLEQSVLNPGGLQQNYTPVPTALPSLNPTSSSIASLDTLSNNSATQRSA